VWIGDITQTLASVLKEEPAWSVLPADKPAAIRRMLRRCLDKEPRRRPCDIGEARIVIEDAISGKDTEPAAVQPQPRSFADGGRQ